MLGCTVLVQWGVAGTMRAAGAGDLWVYLTLTGRTMRARHEGVVRGCAI
jgi:hypothetical protein